MVFKWFLVTLFSLGVLIHLRDAGRHGEPKPPYNARVEAIGAVLGLALVAWALAVLP